MYKIITLYYKRTGRAVGKSSRMMQVIDVQLHIAHDEKKFLFNSKFEMFDWQKISSFCMKTLQKVTKCTLVRIVNLNFEPKNSKTIGSSLRLKINASSFNTLYVDGQSSDLSKDVLWVSVSQMASELQAVKNVDLKKILSLNLLRITCRWYRLKSQMMGLSLKFDRPQFCNHLTYRDPKNILLKYLKTAVNILADYRVFH